MSRVHSDRPTRHHTSRRWRAAIPFALLCLACLGYVVSTYQANKSKRDPVRVTIANPQSATSVPFAGALPTNALVLVEARINGTGPYVFKLDTGAQFSSLSHKIGDLLQSSPAKTASNEASSSPAVTPAVTVDTLEVGAARFQHLLMNVADMPEEVPYDGVLGLDALERCVVSIDYEHRRVSLTLPEKFAFTGDGDVFEFALSEQGTPLIEGTLGTTQTRFEVNTGQETAIKVFQEYVQSNNLMGRYPNYIEYHLGKQSAETLETLAFTHVLAVTLSEDIRFSYPIIAMSDRPSPVNGALGNFFFQQFTVTLDWPHQQMILEKNSRYGHAFPANRAGFLLERDHDIVTISDVVDNSPASEAGLQVEDRVITLASHRIPTLNRFIWDAMLDGAPDTKLSLTVQRGGKTLAFTLKLRDPL